MASKVKGPGEAQVQGFSRSNAMSGQRNWLEDITNSMRMCACVQLVKQHQP